MGSMSDWQASRSKSAPADFAPRPTVGEALAYPTPSTVAAVNTNKQQQHYFLFKSPWSEASYLPFKVRETSVSSA